MANRSAVRKKEYFSVCLRLLVVMKFLKLSLAALALSVLSPVLLAADGWRTDLQQAVNDANKDGKHVLVEFTGSDWCPPCMFMSKEVFSKKSFISAASKDYVLVKLDFPQGNPGLAEKNQKWAEMFKVQGFPTVVLMNPDGKEVDRVVGVSHPSVEAFLKYLRSNLSS